MRLSFEVMTCGFDRWEETMQHMMLVTDNGRKESVISLPTEFRYSGGVDGDKYPSL